MIARNCRAMAHVAIKMLFATWAVTGAADPLAQVTLHWQAPAACPDSAALQAELHRDLEGSQVPGERLDVQAIVERTEANSWRVQIQMQSDQGKSDRSLTARSCTALADATSLIIAMHIDPETAATHARKLDAVSEPAIAPPPGMPPAPTAPIVAYPGQMLPPAPTNMQGNAAGSETKTIRKKSEEKRKAAAGKIESERTTYDAGYEAELRPAAPPHSPLHAFVGAWALVDGGSLPSASPGFGGTVALGYGPWLVETSMGAWLSRDATSTNYTPKPQAGISLSMVTGAGRLCYRLWAPAPISLSPCAGFELVRWSGEGNTQLASHQSQSALGYLPNARLLAALSISEKFSLPVHFDVLLPLNRPKFGFNDVDDHEITVFEPSQVAFRVGAGVQLRFR